MDATERYESGETQKLLARVRELHDTGHRLVQIGCLEVAAPESEAGDTNGANGANGRNGATDDREAGKSLEIIYTFDKAYGLTHLRLTVDKGDHVPSVSDVYDMAFLYENEIHDLFGLTIDGMSLDFKGTFYQKKTVRPFCSPNGTTPVAPEA